MSNLEIITILILTAWAIYRQTVPTKLAGGLGRFKLTLVYAGAGFVAGGFRPPTGPAGWSMIAAGLLLSLVVGLARGRLTQLWVDEQGVTWRKGTVRTVVLFLGLIAAKFGLGALAYSQHIDDGAGFGEVLLMLALMIAVQTQIVHLRANTSITLA